ncbi:hypothetical protein FIBSPDRAFT_1040976 [Athelia psychrophila]|uniref:Uncharacterized protein n=1 Tax=Athelia psychrophila TaxID=1759441 RepID=A0A166PK33_9AGAM|nr:hypothetical protein FIBSPDRAFT_1040976 [Fibularhizoctonia sp. CBS 109695]
MIDHDASFVLGNTPMEEYVLFEVDGWLAEELVREPMKDGKGGLINAKPTAKVRVRLVNALSAPDNIHVGIARGEMAIALSTFVTPASSPAPDFTASTDVTLNPTSTPDTGAGIPIPWLRTWIKRETFPKGWKPSRSVRRACGGRQGKRVDTRRDQGVGCSPSPG